MDGFLVPGQVCAWARIELPQLLAALADDDIAWASFGGRIRMRASSVRARFRVYGTPRPPAPGDDPKITARQIDAARCSDHVVYRCFNADGELLYVGVTSNRRKRFSAHADKVWWHESETVELSGFDTRAEAEDAERKAIYFEAPRYNRRGQKRDRDDGRPIVRLGPDWPRRAA